MLILFQNYYYYYFRMPEMGSTLALFLEEETLASEKRYRYRTLPTNLVLIRYRFSSKIIQRTMILLIILAGVSNPDLDRLELSPIQSRQSTRLFLQSSELGPPHPITLSIWSLWSLRMIKRRNVTFRGVPGELEVESIEWFVEEQALSTSQVLVPSPTPFLPSTVIKLSLFLGLPVCRRSSLRTGEGRKGCGLEGRVKT